MNFTIKNVLTEIFINNTYSPFVLSWERDTKNYYILFINEKNAPDLKDWHDIKAAVRKAFDFFSNVLVYIPTVYISQVTIRLSSFSYWVAHAENNDIKNILNRDRIHIINDFEQKTDIKNEQLYFPRLPKEWQTLLATNQVPALLARVKEYIQSVLIQTHMSPEFLRHTQQDIQQLCYSVLQEKNIPAHEIFNNKELTFLEKSADTSVVNFLKWLTCALTQISQILDKQSGESRAGTLMAEYIDKNYMKRLTRTDIAKSVHLSADHAARLFKKENGVTINDYIANVRINKAKKLLADHSLSISDIALMVGYEHFSYFSTAFKMSEGMTPKEFRKQF